MTYLEIVNAVLRRMRVSEAGFVNDNDYSRLIGDFVNQSKREVEDAHSWLALESNLSVNALAGVAAYRLIGFGRRARVRLVHNTTSKNRIIAQDWDHFQTNVDFSQANGQPIHWRLNGLEEQDPKIEFWPTPEANYTIKVYATVPQLDLTTDSTEVTVPPYPVILGAYALAVAERGDDRGNNDLFAAREYESALNDAIAKDNFNDHAGMGTDWHVPGPRVRSPGVVW